MRGKTGNEFRGIFGEWLNGIRGQLVEGLYLKDTNIANALGCCVKSVTNAATSQNEPAVGAIFAAMANLPRSATQSLMDKLEAMRPVADPVGSVMHEVAQAQQASAGAFAVLAEAMSDNRIDPHERDAYAFKAREASREWGEAAMATM